MHYYACDTYVMIHAIPTYILISTVCALLVYEMLICYTLGAPDERTMQCKCAPHARNLCSDGSELVRAPLARRFSPPVLPRSEAVEIHKEFISRS